VFQFCFIYDNKVILDLYSVNLFPHTFASIHSLENNDKMKNKPYSRSIFLFMVILVPCLMSWGTFGHEHINHAAVLALPSPLQTFFYNHIDFITEESTVPDLRKYTLSDKSENPRHFLDLENFGSLDSLPLTMAAAKVRYDDKFLQQNGILPWFMLDMMDKLTKAQNGNSLYRSRSGPLYRRRAHAFAYVC
jgi:hypothetical protein